MAKKLLSTVDVSLPVITLMTLSGCNPNQSTLLTQSIFWIFCLTTAIFSVAAAIQCVGQDTLVSFSKTYIDSIVTAQTFIKTIYFYVNKDKLSKILEVLWNDFWPVDKIEGETDRHNHMYMIVMRCQRIYRNILICCIIQISLFPILLWVRALPFDLYLFGYEQTIFLKSPYFELMYIFECLTISGAYILCLIPYDMIFILATGCVIVQLDMLKSTLLQVGADGMDDERSFEILRSAVIHHNILLKFVNDLEKIVTVPILKQYLDAISCMGIYIYLAQQDFHFLYVFSLMTNLSQTLFFSWFGQRIQDKSFAIADAAYENNWQEIKCPKIRQGLLMVIQRSHRKNKITAGGFFTLSFETFLGMIKAAGSFLAVLRSTKEN